MVVPKNSNAIALYGIKYVSPAGPHNTIVLHIFSMYVKTHAHVCVLFPRVCAHARVLPRALGSRAGLSFWPLLLLSLSRVQFLLPLDRSSPLFLEWMPLSVSTPCDCSPLTLLSPLTTCSASSPQHSCYEELLNIPLLYPKRMSSGVSNRKPDEQVPQADGALFSLDIKAAGGQWRLPLVS